ncbi:hypothetical protein MSMAP_1075 [Methanosarcina mazei SarPi]|uniref:Uncharacterized protein n=1 Tax=Methanosarcina mazei SarPi TaxID=1434115 RepID=A0A0E3RA44_METMZ|nr:hypothetical protein MSMAP_1075 [Methanosarcina mazei SarPi]
MRLGFTYSALALSLGISEDTLYSWIRKGRDEQTQPYLSFYAGLKEAESELLAECLNQLKISMKMGNVDSAKFLLERRFNGVGYGKSSQIDMKAQTQNLNLNVNTGMTAEDADKIREEILSRLSPKPLPEGF